MKKFILVFLIYFLFVNLSLNVNGSEKINYQKVTLKNNIGTYSTTFNSDLAERQHNIKLATNSINNVVIRPFGTFSFNKIVGEASLENGYKVAKVVLYDDFVDGVGGGICQVSSTLFNAVEQSDLEVLEIHHHTAGVSYVPENKDATIAYGVKDFKFLNNSENTIVIRAKIIDNNVVVDIFNA